MSAFLLFMKVEDDPRCSTAFYWQRGAQRINLLASFSQKEAYCPCHHHHHWVGNLYAAIFRFNSCLLVPGIVGYLVSKNSYCFLSAQVF